MQCPTVSSTVYHLRAEMRVRAPSLRRNSCSWDSGFTARMSSSRKSEKK